MAAQDNARAVIARDVSQEYEQLLLALGPIRVGSSRNRSGGSLMSALAMPNLSLIPRL